MAWFETERPALLALLRVDDPAYVCQLAWATHVLRTDRGTGTTGWPRSTRQWKQQAGWARRLGITLAPLPGLQYADLGRYADAHVRLDRALALASNPVDRAWTEHYRDLTLEYRAMRWLRWMRRARRWSCSGRRGHRGRGDGTQRCGLVFGPARLKRVGTR